MTIKTQSFTIDTEITVPIGDMFVAISPDQKLFVCNVSKTFEANPEPCEGWTFAEVFNRIEMKFKVPAGSKIVIAEDDNDNSFIEIPAL